MRLHVLYRIVCVITSTVGLLVRLQVLCRIVGRTVRIVGEITKYL